MLNSLSTKPGEGQTKAGALDLLHTAYGPVGMPPSVYREAVTQGKKKGSPDALAVEKAVERGWLRQVILTPKARELAERLRNEIPPLGQGESEALAYAETENVPLLIEERRGKAVARAREISYTIAQMIPIEAYILGEIDVETCEETLEKIAVLMNTDIAVVSGLKDAVQAIERARRGGGDGQSAIEHTSAGRDDH